MIKRFLCQPRAYKRKEIFQVSSWSIYKMTRDHRVWYSPSWKRYEKSLVPNISWSIFVFSFASVASKIHVGERNACLQRLPLQRRSANQTSGDFVAGCINFYFFNFYAKVEIASLADFLPTMCKRVKKSGGQCLKYVIYRRHTVPTADMTKIE